MRAGLVAQVLLASAFFGACGRPGKGPEPLDSAAILADSVAEADSTASRLIVESSAIWDVRVYLLRGGQYVRLGIAGPGTTTTFVLKSIYLNRDLQFYAEAIGAAARQRTDPVYVRTGQDVTLKLENRLRSYVIDVR
jgi:hypothetical protein